MAKNIHDINIKNKTIPAATKCHKCEYETNDPNSMDSHVVSLHCFVQCDKCEYIAEGNDIMKKHKMNTLAVLFLFVGLVNLKQQGGSYRKPTLKLSTLIKPLGGLRIIQMDTSV